MRYLGIYSNGLIDERQELLVLSQNPMVEYILKVDQEINNSGYAYDSCITLIDGHGSLRTLTVDGFRLSDIGTRYYDSALKEDYVELTICETRLNQVFHIRVEYVLYELMQLQILPLMNKLNELNSYASFMVMQENERLTQENAELKQRLGE